MDAKKLLACGLGILLVGLVVRVVHLQSVPGDNESSDEYFWTWTGMGLVQDGVPKGWSVLPFYDDEALAEVRFKGETFTIVAPCMDHPPLYSVAMGLWMTALGYRDILTVDLLAMRLSSLLLFTITFALTGLLAMQVTGPRQALVALATMALSSPIVVNSKLVVSENFFVVIVLGTLLALLRHLGGGSRRWLVLVGVGALCLPLSKIAALGLSLALLFVAVAHKDKLAALVVSAATVGGLVVYVVYGLAVGGDTFVGALQSQAGRFQGFTSAFSLLLVPKVVNQPLTYGLFFLALAALVVEGARGRMKAVVIPLITYACVMGFFANRFLVFGWYLIPLYPFLCIGIARAIAVMWSSRSGRMLWLWMLLVVPFTLDALTATAPSTTSALRYLYLALAIGVPGAALWGVFGNAWVRRGTVATLVGVHVVADMLLLFRVIPDSG